MDRGRKGGRERPHRGREGGEDDRGTDTTDRLLSWADVFEHRSYESGVTLDTAPPPQQHASPDRVAEFPKVTATQGQNGHISPTLDKAPHGGPEQHAHQVGSRSEDQCSRTMGANATLRYADVRSGKERRKIDVTDVQRLLCRLASDGQQIKAW
ncbi:hypothetical protein EYF80_018784 [Liparis tanakae]|uniref:Uncharacterized protein n=1 Tax=Liparis tanakae TaxID=230148 RepID=A0A4Z2HZ71_9TELE|nr:hypothetical protein EYF80_018784 [Liparis tanakae]